MLNVVEPGKRINQVDISFHSSIVVMARICTAQKAHAINESRTRDVVRYIYISPLICLSKVPGEMAFDD